MQTCKGHPSRPAAFAASRPRPAIATEFHADCSVHSWRTQVPCSTDARGTCRAEDTPLPPIVRASRGPRTAVSDTWLAAPTRMTAAPGVRPIQCPSWATHTHQLLRLTRWGERRGVWPVPVYLCTRWYAYAAWDWVRAPQLQVLHLPSLLRCNIWRSCNGLWTLVDEARGRGEFPRGGPGGRGEFHRSCCFVATNRGVVLGGLLFNGLIDQISNIIFHTNRIRMLSFRHF